ncbi:bifunctional [glutamate--ammonia ligase]-adenylyl-L-tyrosine phosphorylase/[glutamate--ammonia-ligase] adenylyltransferase [Luteimonas sp. BDR2-5]|uniref:bifunctional [glutamate--ammonia ligase]-adenylyl-L-tyrosine phosphorylase/[glutamate--ammonia-ligase] adenylyltransferase n=1 Tax=Proluteimonas luteida TaxID=2878685 RepID=UPI001E623AC8|nr:bifunctional [glutamate--ammonia ligase]-adenylyl-L-tyrosine phosphorylase/[glutamate--ammonia-ligase] adenylyltransferase [Luteimonas sp. BDR2-5]MCD9027375.1 bifunctional [glutamate--ammonia ligase]-adenylyl-L-tyrosine phosphorylase/[glutamate--ammonia-ligase] adenylyltransferase [Luteimonas sp. BDR2-5]
MDDAPISAALDAHVARALARLGDVSADAAARLARIAVVSDFAIGTLSRQPDLLARLLADDGDAELPLPGLDADNRGDWPALLRRYRAAASTRLIWRDVSGLDDVDATLAGTTRLAETCLRLALDALEAEFARRHGVVRDAGGNPVRLVVFGLGKLGGGELNFSSDIDLVYAFESDGDSDGARALAAEDYFTRLGQQLAKLLDETTADGFSHRVDLRLRPFGSAGRIALGFSALELYFQREGRDWERYAWQKARPVAGDIAAGERFLATLRPFVYRRYIDFGALDGLRQMKAMIAAEVARRELADDIKRGPGGIREIEFLAQALQLIRGGREPALRERRLLPALNALYLAGQLPAETLSRLGEAYRFLRRLENRLQMLRDAQTHVLPQAPLDRLRIATGLGYRDWDALAAALQVQRGVVSQEFDALLAQRTRAPEVDSDLSGYWRALPAHGERAVLEAAGFADAANVDAALRDFARSPSVRELSDGARARLDRLMPVLLQASAPADRPLQAIRRLLALLHNILRRASYLALLDEQPAALARLVDVVTRSAFLAERLAAHPLLLDELLDVRIEGPLPQHDQVDAACARALQQPDLEAALLALNETRQQLSFRVALATLDRRISGGEATRQLAWLADAVVDVVLTLALREMTAAHGALPGARFAIIGYGSLGGEELGFGSDLDLVFLYDAPADAQSEGARPLDAQRWAARLTQKVVSLLGSVTGGGRLYDVDVRLRPDGGKGMLVSSLASYADYQRARAWTWEHQALVRARFVAGDAAMADDFERVRSRTLCTPRDPGQLHEDVVAMRRRMRAELDRSTDAMFDLKQGEGGLVDLEFLLQELVLREAARHPALLQPRATAGLLAAAGDAGLLAAGTVAGLQQAHATLLLLGLDRTLDRRARMVPPSEDLEAARALVRAATGGN